MWVAGLCPEVDLAHWHLGRGELTEAGLLLDKVRTAVESSHHVGSTFWLETQTLFLDYAAGRWNRAEDRASSLRRYVFLFPDSAVEQATVSIALAAARGHTAEARRLVSLVLAEVPADDLVASVWIRGFAAHAELSVGDPVAAVNWLDPIAARLRGRAYADAMIVCFECDLIESYARVGRMGEAAERLTWLRQTADRLEHPLARLVGSRCAGCSPWPEAIPPQRWPSSTQRCLKPGGPKYRSRKAASAHARLGAETSPNAACRRHLHR